MFEDEDEAGGGVPGYDCQSCGACCVHLGPFDGTGYVPLEPDEARRMRRHGLRVVGAALGSPCLAAAPHEGAWGYPACVGFVGELGRECGCSVYRDRPAVCRRFEAGSGHWRGPSAAARPGWPAGRGHLPRLARR